MLPRQKRTIDEAGAPGRAAGALLRHNEHVGWTAFQCYKNKWVLCSKAKVLGGAPVDVEPVRLIEAGRDADLEATLRYLLAEELPDVQPPDLNDPKTVLGLRAKAVGAKTWRAFENASRTFVLTEEHEHLVLEEWPRDGGRFVWRKAFPACAVDEVVKHVVQLTGQRT